MGTDWEFLDDSSDEEDAGGRLFMDANATALKKRGSKNVTKLSDGSFANLHPVIIETPGLLANLPEKDWGAHCECKCSAGTHDHIVRPGGKASVR